MMGGFRKFSKADGSVDVIAQHRFVGIDVTCEKAFDAFAQEFLTERGVAANACATPNAASCRPATRLDM